MRWFWLFILGLVVLTGGLYANRVRTKGVIAPIERRAARVVDEPIVEEESREEKSVQREEHEELEVVEVVEEEVVEDGIIEAEPDQETEFVLAAAEEAKPEPEPEPVVIEESIEEPVVEAADEIVIDVIPTPVEAPEPEVADVIEEAPAPSYEQFGDGSFKVISTGSVIKGSGAQADPFLVDWVTLRSVERGYNPKKGKTHLPEWLDVLDEKYVRITGNTLVPVIATTTRELLVMQNPWDGCCIGIPPSPYDAIEVALNHDVDFGSSAIGYGTVEGVFILDPYVVDGWVLGLYMIDDATYRSGDGIAFPDF